MASDHRSLGRAAPLARYDRRSFLALAGGAIGGAVLLAACGGGDDDDPSGNPAPPIENEHFTELAPGVLSADLFKSDEEQRFAFAMLAKEGYASGMNVRIAVAPGQDADPTDFQPTTLHNEGLPPNRGVYVLPQVLPQAGIWSGIADAEGTKIPFVFQVYDEPRTATPGVEAPRAASPTLDNKMGMNPICTRDPICPLHDRSLSDLVGKGRPVALLFATPARCQSAYCGPVLDEMLAVMEPYTSKVDFVHCDIYKDLHSDATSPAVEAWNLPGEPFMFGIDGNGFVTNRLDGAFDRNEMKALLDQLAS